MNGQGVYSDGKGAVYTGEFKDGKYHGEGEMRWTMGTYGKHHLTFSGTATGIWQNGEFYTGKIDQFTPQHQSRNIKHIENGRCTYCTVTQKDGSQYVYTFSNGTHTQKFIYGNGQVYVGQLKVFPDYLPHGTGTMTYPEGKQYVGEWENGRPIQDRGTLYAADGKPIKTPKGLSWENILIGLGLVIGAGAVINSLGGGQDSSTTDDSGSRTLKPQEKPWLYDPEKGGFIRPEEYQNKYGVPAP